MRCSRCQCENPPGSNFCLGCGMRLGLICGACGTDLPTGSRFCNNCGTPVSGESTWRVRFASPESYTPKHLAERILTSKSALEGERKQVTVLFCDIVESTRLAERLDPETMHDVMDRALRLMAEAVHRYEGTVNQFLGDGLMALFGAPIALEDHARRAVLAALAIQETISGLSTQLMRDRGFDLMVRIGINTGLVVVGKIGDDLRMDYTAVGDTTHLAARLQQTAEAGTILAAGPTHRLVEGYVRSEALGRVEVKGHGGAVPIYRIVGQRRRTRMEVRADRGLTSLIGRRRELDLLRERFERARSGRGQVVGIVGEAGVGKSRLVWEFRASLESDHVLVVEGDCTAHAQATPYGPITGLLRSSFQIEDGDNPFQVEDKLRRGVAALDPALANTLPLLRELLALPVDPAIEKLEPRARRQKTFEAIRALTATAAQRRPHVIVIEDLHWIDKTSEDYLAFLIESLAAMPVLLLTTSRPGYAGRWTDRAYFTQIALDVLDEGETAAILAACLGARELPAGLVDLVQAKAEGNPLFVEEIARSLVDRGAVIRRNEGLIWAGDPLVDYPATGQDIIRARIDQLPEPVKRTLQTAAVIGREFSVLLLERISETPNEVGDHLQTLKRLELIHEARFFPDVWYAFKHALIQDVAYETLLGRRRRGLHAAIGRALEDLYAGRLAESYEILAHHFSAADDRAKAVNYLTLAGDRAAAVFANLEAAARYEQAVILLDEVDFARRARLLQRIAEVGFYYADPDKNLHQAEEALTLHQRLKDHRGAMAMHLHIAALYVGGGWDGAREDRALEHLEAAAAICEDEPDSVAKGLVYQRTAHLYLHRGAAATAGSWAQRAVDTFSRLAVPMGTALGTASSYLGRIDEGVAYNEGNWPAVVKLGNPLVIAILGHELTCTLALARDVKRAREWGERALGELLRILAQNPNPSWEGPIRRPLALSYVLGGEAVLAAAECEIVEEISRRTWLGCAFEETGCVGLHHLRCGDWETARTVTERALAVMIERNQVAAVSGCCYALGCVDLAEGRSPDAEAHLARSLEICRTGGNVLFELWVLPVLVELYLTTARPDRAGECVERGFTLLAPDRNWYGLPAGMHLARGMLARGRRDWDEADTSFERAVSINRGYGLPWDEAKALSEWARMLLARGSASARERARERLSLAGAIFERVGASRELEKVRTALEPLRA